MWGRRDYAALADQNLVDRAWAGYHLGVAHRYEEFPDHSGVDYRMDESLPFLARALTG